MYSEDFRVKIVKAYETGIYTYIGLSNKFDVSVPFVWSLVNLYKTTGKVIDIKPRKKSVDRKLSGKYELILINLIKERPSITLVEISDYFLYTYDFKVGKSSVDRKLSDLKITLKKKGTITQRRTA